MQQANVNWQRQLGVDMNDFARQQGEAAHQAARMFQHDGRQMYVLQEDRIRTTAAEVETLLSKERARVESALREYHNEEHRALQRMRKEARSCVAHESHAYGTAQRPLWQPQ